MDFSRYAQRRQELLQKIKEQHPEKKGIVLLLAGIEHSKAVFRQESSFYYLTGLTEPGNALVMNLDGGTTLYVPNFGAQRAKWVSAAVDLIPDNASLIEVDSIQPLGDLCAGYQFHPFFPKAEYQYLLNLLAKTIVAGESIFTLYPAHPYAFLEQRLLLKHMADFVPGILEAVVNISPLVAEQRRKKDQHEIEMLYKAIGITGMAQEAAASVMNPAVSECEVQAALEYMFTGSCARAAFPSIVAGGKNGTILHYHDNNQPLKKGDLVVVDIGAESNYYCADITRTYPVSGKFSKRQQELYELVLETQTYIADLAQPGYWLSYKEQPEKSLHHLAVKFLETRGYGKYFTHGIGHFLGLDVHDVGDYSKPLQPGDVITIEPGIYIPEEGIGIRIEDDYWIVEDGAVCLSEDIPKDMAAIEKMVQEKQ
jgi:Xaa-Pro aminopeptidase